MTGYVFDENITKAFHLAVIRHNHSATAYPLDVVAVGRPNAPPKGTRDPELIAWASREARILVTFDSSTMQPHLDEFLATGASSPGILTVRKYSRVPAVVESLEMIAYASSPEEFANRIDWIPLS